MNCTVNLHNQQPIIIAADKVPAMARRVWHEEGTGDAELDIILLNDSALLTLNQQYLNRSSLTDVIAFELSEEEDEQFAGEIYISVDRIIENAATFGVTPETELLRVVAHAVLHFLGYSDGTPPDKQVMSVRENFYLQIMDES